MSTKPIDQLLEVMRKLRDPETGCPWDREQNLETLKPFLIEECYELIDAIDSGDVAKHKDELGDMLLQIVFQVQLRQEKGEFGFDDICNGLIEKMVRRHPHVFGDVKVSSSAEVLENWEALKAQEKGRTSATEGVPLGQPALALASKLLYRTEKFNYKIPVEHPVKLLETTTEEELGTLIFGLWDQAVAQGLDAEAALRAATKQYIKAIHEYEAEQPRATTP